MVGTLTRGHDWGGDFSAYIMQAKSIVEGNPSGFVESNRFTIQHSSFPPGPVAYPWGFPMLLAPIYATFGLSPLALKAVGVICFLLFPAVLWITFRPHHGSFWIVGIVCLVTWHPQYVAFPNSILSDLPFLLVSTMSIWLIREVVVLDHRITTRLADRILLGITLAAGILLRSIGILLAITLAFSQAISFLQQRARGHGGAENGRSASRSQSTAASLGLPLTPFVVFLAVLLASNLLFPEGGGSYLARLNEVSRWMVKANLAYYIGLPAQFLSDAPLGLLLFGATVPLAVAGAIQRHRSDYPAIIYGALTVLLLSAWPERQGTRFLWPILPFYLSFTLSGLEAFGEGSRRSERVLRRLVSYLPVILVAGAFLTSSLRAAGWSLVRDTPVEDGPWSEPSQELFAWILNETQPNSILVFFKPRVMKLMTGRQSYMTNRIEQLSEEEYLVLLREDAFPQISKEDLEKLVSVSATKLMFENGDFVVYRILKTPRPAGQ